MNVKTQDAYLAVTAGGDCVVIKGYTEDGKRFRPSDWAERLATTVGQFGANRRIRFHPHVRLATMDREKCVIVDLALEKEEPLLFEFLMHFAQSNRLQTEFKGTVAYELKHKARVG